MSDTEASGAVSNLQGQQARVRQHSLAALFAVVKVSKITFKLLPSLALVLVEEGNIMTWCAAFFLVKYDSYQIASVFFLVYTLGNVPC